jgi:magnesium-transporting ATPase (P-type)
MEQYIDIFEPILTIVLALFISLFFLGILIKLFSIYMIIMAYPTFLALYSFELLLNYKEKDLNKRKFFRLNIPKGTSKRFWMNFIAMFNTSLLIGIAFIFIQSIINFKFVNIPYQVSITILSCLFIIYFISFFVEVDNKTAYDKINSLTIPSLLKKTIN